MQVLNYSNNSVNWNGTDYTFNGIEKNDEICVNMYLDNQIICFVGGDTEINGVIKNNADEIINTFKND